MLCVTKDHAEYEHLVLCTTNDQSNIVPMDEAKDILYSDRGRAITRRFLYVQRVQEVVFISNVSRITKQRFDVDGDAVMAM